MVNRKKNNKTATKAKRPLVKENELGDGAVSDSASFNKSIDSRSDIMQDTCQAAAAHLQIPMQDGNPACIMQSLLGKPDSVLNHYNLTSEKSTDQDGGKDSFQTDAPNKLVSHSSEQIVPEANIFSLKSDAASIQPASSSTKETEISLQSDATPSTKETGMSLQNDASPSQPAPPFTKETGIYLQNDASPVLKTGKLVKNTTNATKQNIGINYKALQENSVTPQLTLPSENKTSIQEFSRQESCDVITTVGSSSSPSALKTKNDSAQNASPVILQNITTTNDRPKTPDNPIPAAEIFSPGTLNELRSTIRTLWPNGPPPPPPIIPVKRYKKGKTPYIVGCTKRKRVPESKTLNVFKGDDYGITSKTNALVDDDECTARKRGRRTYNGNWSKSLFNPKSDEIAARLKLNERVDELLRKSPNKETVMFMSKPYSSRSQAFSPLPSTSKDNETILKNEKHFSESLNFDANDYDIGDDDELPDISWSSNCKPKIKEHMSSLRNENLETTSKPIIIDENMNNNNNNDDTEFQEIDFCGILSNKQVVIDDTIVNLENVMEDMEPKANNNKEPLKIIDTIEIKDDYNANEELSSIPKTEVIGDIDEILAELDAFKEKKGIKKRRSVVTVVDPITLESNVREQINSVDLDTSLNQTKTGGALKGVPSTSTKVIEIPETIESIVDLCNNVATSKANPTYFCNEDVEFISETSSSRVMNRESRLNKLDMQSNANKENITAGSNSDIEVVQNDFASSHIDTVSDIRDESRSSVLDDLQMFFMLCTNSRLGNMDPLPWRRRKAYTPKKPSPNKLPAPEQDVTGVNNENAAPSTNGQATSTNGELRLGDCPICMESLSNNSIASTTCGHVFCVNCIKRCLKTSGKRCPTCRKQLRGAGYHQVFL